MEKEKEEEVLQSHNVSCSQCKKTFYLDKTQKNIKCIHCGYRILLKIRTRNYVTYKTE